MSWFAGTLLAVWTATGDVLLVAIPPFFGSIFFWTVISLLGFISSVGLLVGAGGVLCLYADSQEQRLSDARSGDAPQAWSSLDTPNSVVNSHGK